MKKNKTTNKIIANSVVREIQDIFVSVVVVLKPESNNVDQYISNIFKVLNSNYTNYEIIVIDNGASFDEINSVVALLGNTPCIRVVKLSQQFKYDTAIFAGLEVSIGDYVCTLDSTMDPVDDIVRFITKSQSFDIVQGISNVPISGVFGSSLGRRLFYWYNRKYLGIDISVNATYLACYSRRAINFLTTNSRNGRYIRHSARRIGSGYSTLDYSPVNNPSNQRSLRTGIIEALEITTSYSTHPLRFVTWLGLIAGLVNVLYAIYVLSINLYRSDLTPGWTSTSMQLSLMFFVLFMIMIILAEYIGRILAESYNDPNYLVSDELVSTVALADTDRRNISR